ncbi:urease accessory UreF family protein [Bradyrhizobium sp. ARR65]|uniref:urease accessory protein UreF n=1 Tax=Bradyrhizobium sp. ARR65 TaxID=1040989 RepID=UPI0004667F5D|nr:urease accessory UreF family protein [Bradyrhizobium sp. ARR65]
MLSTLRAIWQTDGAFPNGSFAFSYGIEGAIALRRDMSLRDFEALIEAMLKQRWAGYDRVAMLLSYRAHGDLAAIAMVDREVEASTLIEALRTGSRRNGASYLAAHARLGEPLAVALRDAVKAGDCCGHIAVMQGAVWSALGLGEPLSQLCSGYVAASGVITAAVRLGIVGALQGQGVLQRCLPLIEQLTAQDTADEVELMSFIPFLDIAAARHARADLRLFAN